MYNLCVGYVVMTDAEGVLREGGTNLTLWSLDPLPFSGYPNVLSS